jgi:putative addiction module killer protein
METKQTPQFADWLGNLTDLAAERKIRVRIARMEAGLMGNVEPVGNGVSEAKIDFGPGYRLYFVKRGKELIILLCGGDKSTQKRDIVKAKELAAQL